MDLVKDRNQSKCSLRRYCCDCLLINQDRGYRVHNDLRAPRTDEPTARYIFITNLPQSLPAQYSHYEVLDLSQAQELFTTGEIQGLSYKIARLPEPPELPLSNDLFYTKRSRNLKLDRAYDMLSRPIPNVAADPIPANPSFPPETSGSENQLEDEQDQENNNEDSSEEDIDELMDLMALNLDGDFGWQQDFNYEAVRVRGSLNNPVVEWVIIVRKDGVLDEEDDLELGVGHHQIRIHSEQPLNTPNPMLGVGSGAGDHSGVFEVWIWARKDGEGFTV